MKKTGEIMSKISENYSLYDLNEGNIVDAYLKLKKEPNGEYKIKDGYSRNHRKQRKKNEEKVSIILKKKNLREIDDLRIWEMNLKKEIFYAGIKALFTLEKTGKTKF
jgi:hypothetical protein